MYVLLIIAAHSAAVELLPGSCFNLVGVLLPYLFLILLTTLMFMILIDIVLRSFLVAAECSLLRTPFGLCWSVPGGRRSLSFRGRWEMRLFLGFRPVPLFDEAFVSTRTEFVSTDAPCPSAAEIVLSLPLDLNETTPSPLLERIFFSRPVEDSYTARFHHFLLREQWNLVKGTALMWHMMVWMELVHVESAKTLATRKGLLKRGYNLRKVPVPRASCSVSATSPTTYLFLATIYSLTILLRISVVSCPARHRSSPNADALQSVKGLRQACKKRHQRNMHFHKLFKHTQSTFYKNKILDLIFTNIPDISVCRTDPFVIPEDVYHPTTSLSLDNTTKKLETNDAEVKRWSHRIILTFNCCDQVAHHMRQFINLQTCIATCRIISSSFDITIRGCIDFANLSINLALDPAFQHQ
uniref:Uncharacterized protein n=1 Tax=Glossina austeni TaxID=7395 RepID=A0A1A9V7W0_GLOAU